MNAFEKNMADATYGAFLEFIDTVSAKDDKTVSFTLKYPFDSLLKGRLSVVKVFPASLTEDDLKTKPIGSGPWVYDTINGDDGGSIEFVPNTNYNASTPLRPTRCTGTSCSTTPPAPPRCRRPRSRSWRTCPTPTPNSSWPPARPSTTSRLQPAVLHVQHAQEAVRR